MNLSLGKAEPNARARLVDWWHGRARREQWMLSLMCAAIAVFIGWYGVLAPLLVARDRAAERHASAIQDRVEIEQTLARVAAASQDRPAPPPVDRFHALVADSAGAAGIGLERQEPSPDGGVEVGIDAVPANALFAWLDTLRLEHGIAPEAVDIERREGRLRARLRFGPPA
ncbi:type II secretion system protein GspM [Luteimonas sp. A277]